MSVQSTKKTTRQNNKEDYMSLQETTNENKKGWVGGFVAIIGRVIDETLRGDHDSK